MGMTDTADTVSHLGLLLYSGEGEPAVMGCMQMLPETEYIFLKVHLK